MTIKLKVISGFLTASVLLMAGCGATPPKKPEGPPPPQNLVGSTDQLQLVSELSLNLAREYGPNQLMVVLAADGTLLAASADNDVCRVQGNAVGKPMQQDTAEQVMRIREAGIPVVISTQRDSSCSQQTESQLSSIGIEPPFNTLYTGGQAKGPALHQKIQSSGDEFPVLIIMADNEQKSLSSVMKEFSELGTKVHSWRYTRSSDS